MTNNKQTYDWTKSGSFIKMLDTNRKRTQNQVLKSKPTSAPKSRNVYLERPLDRDYTKKPS